MKIYTAVLSLLLFSTSAAAQNPDPSKWTCRNLADSGGFVNKPSVFVDDAAVGNLHNGDSLKFTLKPGKHRIDSTDKSTGIDLEVKPGETYYVRVDILVGFWKGHGGVTIVDPQQGKYELGQVSH